MKLPFINWKSIKTLEEIGNRCGTDKTRRHGYHRFYPLFLEQYRDKRIVILEIGLYRGASLDMWLEYFPFAFVYGPDIDGPEQQGERFHVMKGDQSDIRCLGRFEGKDLDFIIDDGSHVPRHQLSSFSFLFSMALKGGGTYLIEDIETPYWRHGTLYGYEFDTVTEQRPLPWRFSSTRPILSTMNSCATATWSAGMTYASSTKKPRERLR